MGYYINKINGKSIGDSMESKCEEIQKAGGKEVPGTEYHKDLICIVDNGSWAAAGWCVDEKEFDHFKIPDGRYKRWFILENAESYVD